MTSASAPEPFNEQLWYTLFAEGHPLLVDKQTAFRSQGRPPRCKLCLAPFGGSSDTHGNVPAPSNRNPRYCSLCDDFIRANPGGAKVRLSMVFADVRDSTRLAEELELKQYVHLLNGFYASTTGVFVQTDGFLMDIVGDEVFAMYPPGFSGASDPDAKSVAQRERVAARKAWQAVRELVHVSRGSLPHSLSFGTSLHTAEVYVGTVRGAEEGICDVRVWGPEVNRAARLCALARPGEVMVTEAACLAADEAGADLERREVSLSGFAQPTAVRILRAP